MDKLQRSGILPCHGPLLTLLYQLRNRFTGPSSGLEPAFDLFGPQIDPRWVIGRVVGADLVNEAAVARRARIRHYDSEKRLFAAAVAAQSHHQRHQRTP